MVARRQYSDADKAAALAALDANGGAVRKTAEELGINPSMLSRWDKQREESIEETEPIDALNDRERLFVTHYLATFNATKAAGLAGYAGDSNTLGVQGHRLLKNAKIRAEIDAALNDYVMPVSEVLARLAEHARGDAGEFISLDYELDAINHPQSRLIKKFKKTVRTDKDGAVTHSVEVELYDAQAALEKLGRYHKLFTDRTEVTGKDGEALAAKVTHAVDEQSADRLADIARILAEVNAFSAQGTDTATDAETQ